MSAVVRGRAGTWQRSSLASLQHSFSAAMFMMTAICMSFWMAAASHTYRLHGCARGPQEGHCDRDITPVLQRPLLQRDAIR